MTEARYWILLVWVVAGADGATFAADPDIHCWCASYPNVTFCSWAEPSNEAPLSYTASYSERRQPSSSKPCHLTPPTPSSSERLWHCHLPDLKLLTDYILNVTTLWSTGKSSSHLSSFMLEDIVKPDPPVDVKVSPHHDKRVSMEWSPPPTWSRLDMAPLKYQIKYQWEHKGRAKSVSMGPLESSSVELRGLRPGREYTFEVCAQDLLGLGQCSRWSRPVSAILPASKMS
ncbi:interleukin-27 subunit beta [Stigmatopora argus]